MPFDNLGYRVLVLVPVVLSLGVHEWAHATMAFRLGDPTAEEQGRMSLNPFVHIDPVGTILLPLLGLPWGWAKPVPIDPARFRDDVPMTRGVLLTALAGPLSNVALAAVSGAAIAAITRAAPALWATQPAVAFFLSQFFLVNVALAVFNLLPIPPLDGGRVVEGLVPFEWRGGWDRVASFGTPILIALFVLPGFFGFSLFGWLPALMRYVTAG